MHAIALHSRFVSSMAEINRTDWHALIENAGPFVDYDFLLALETCGCVGEGTGWQPQHLIVEHNQQLVAAMPGYVKMHSYGEYVFDHAWANAYAQYGLDYYPKWISAVPFTPVTGPRLLMRDSKDVSLILDCVSQHLSTLEASHISSLHILFTVSNAIDRMPFSDFAVRHSVQFQWHNYGYQSFSDFLNALTSRRRKSIKRERQQIVQQGIEVRTLTGDEISDKDWAFFIHCYQQTYFKRSGHAGYLTPRFFEQIRSIMKSRLMLIMAYQQQMPVASALFFYDGTGLYGRYWGATKDIDHLHFECCYYQGIDFAIKHQLPRFNPGTQGEHKLLRGFEPLYCASLHKLFRQDFHHAVSDFLARETPMVMNYYQQALAVLPFNQENLSRLSVYNQPYAPLSMGQQ